MEETLRSKSEFTSRSVVRYALFLTLIGLLLLAGSIFCLWSDTQERRVFGMFFNLLGITFIFMAMGLNLVGRVFKKIEERLS